ncbi:MAG: SpoIIE family protein phosphatase [Actinobacteria bacterium]|nr:SpoIIE family protein phosphatase [Actinomycetota bacterium]MBW3650617.1 SpoIIE family protein phosphatase [Actinomycetota bacterium]
MSEPIVPRRLDADRLVILAQAAKALHAERDPAHRLSWALSAAEAVSGLPDSAICLLPRHGSPTWSLSGGRIDFSLLEDPRSIPLLGLAIETGNPVVIPDVAAAERPMPPEARVGPRLDLQSMVLAPVMSRDGLAQGVIVVGDTVPRTFDVGQVEALVALAAHLGVALDNSATLARMAEVEARGKEVVHALQEAVRPPAPVVPFTELGVHYVAADPSAPTGGDLYDWINLPNGDLHLVVVDVMGKGVEATKHALSVTHALRLLAVEGCPLDQIVARADVLVTAQNPDLVATLLVARYRPTTGELTLAGAGHPPALVVGGQSVHEVAAPGIPIGWPGAGSHRIVELRLERAETLIIYTDGLIESTKDILRGLEDLARAAAATSSYPATSLARALVERQLADAARHDDTLALVLRRRSPAPGLPTHMLAPFVHQFSPQAAAVPVARHLLRDWLERVPVETPAVHDLLLTVSELCSNAVRHATGAPGSVALRAWAETDSILIEVSDDGSSLLWPEHVPDELPDPESEQGRGLFLVRELVDEVTSRLEEGRTVVRVLKRAVIGSDRSRTFGAAPASVPVS